MKKLILSTLLLAFMVSSNVFGQSYISSINKFEFSKDIPVRSVEAPDRAQLAEEDALRDRQGLLYRIAVARLTNVNTSNSGIWSTLSNGDRQWQLIVNAPGAEAISFLFETLKETNPLMIRPIVIPAKYVPIKVPAVPFDIVRMSTK